METPEKRVVNRKLPSGNSQKRKTYEGHDVDGLNDDFEGFGVAVLKELSRRASFVRSDFIDGLTFKSFSSALATFCSTFFATMSLATHLQGATKNRIGITEYLFMNAAAGMLHAIFGVQPLLILRPTETTTLMLIFLSKTADLFNFDFYQLLAATGYFLGVNLILISLTEASRFMRYVTRFTYELFLVFICSLYIYDGISDIIGDFKQSGSSTEEKTAEWGNSLFMSCLAVLTFGLAMGFHFAKYWTILTKDMRILISCYALPVAVIASTLFSYSFRVASSQVERVQMPQMLGPTCSIADTINRNNYDTPPCVTDDSVSSTARDWEVNFRDLGTINLWILAFFCAIPVSFLFFMDQNIASLLSQQPHTKLRKGAYYHASFLIMGIFNALGPSFGLPFVTGSSPHSQQFVKYLTTYNSDYSVKYINENRLTPFAVYFFIGMTLFFPEVINLVPLGTIRGVLIFIGITGLINCQFWDRIVCFFKPHEDFAERYNSRGIAEYRVHLYTAFQMVIFVACWIVNLAPGGIFVVFVIASLVPIRIFLLPCIFSDLELVVLENTDVLDPNYADGGGLPSKSTNGMDDSKKDDYDMSTHSNATDASALPLMSSTHGSVPGTPPHERLVRNAMLEASRAYVVPPVAYASSLLPSNQTSTSSANTLPPTSSQNPAPVASVNTADSGNLQSTTKDTAVTSIVPLIPPPPPVQNTSAPESIVEVNLLEPPKDAAKIIEPTIPDVTSAPQSDLKATNEMKNDADTNTASNTATNTNASVTSASTPLAAPPVSTDSSPPPATSSTSPSSISSLPKAAPRPLVPPPNPPRPSSEWTVTASGFAGGTVHASLR